MIILTLKKKSFRALKQAALKYIEQVDLVEIRLDCLSDLNIEKQRSFFKDPKILITFRSSLEGGAQNVSDLERQSYLKKVIDLKPAFLDLEFFQDQALIKELQKKSPHTKLILSYHAKKFDLGSLKKVYQLMSKCLSWRYKIVAPAITILDALKMLSLIQENKKLIGICVGQKGQVTRLISSKYYQPITYACLSPSKNSYSQLSLKELKEWRYKEVNARTHILGLIGIDLSLSPGVKIYNTLFSHFNINARYLNFEISEEELKDFIFYAQKLGFKGLSVTAPFKEAVLNVLPEPQKIKDELKAINTILFQKQKIRTLNTDKGALIQILQLHFDGAISKAAIIGAGGAAMGCAQALKELGARIAVFNRSETSGKKLAQKIEGDFYPLKEIPKKMDAELVVQTTPLKKALLKKYLIHSKIIVDLAYKSTIERQLYSSGQKIYNALSFWKYQAFLQCQFWFKKLPETFEKKLMEM